MCLRKQEHQKTVCVLGLEEDWQFAQAVIVNVVARANIFCQYPSAENRDKEQSWCFGKETRLCRIVVVIVLTDWISFVVHYMQSAAVVCYIASLYLNPQGTVHEHCVMLTCLYLFSLLLRSLQHWPRSWTPAGNSCWRKRKRYLSSKPRGTTPGWGQCPYSSLLNFPYLTYFNMTIGIQ